MRLFGQFQAEVHWQPAGRSVRTLCGVGFPRSPPTTAALTSLAPCARGRSTVQDIEDHHTNQRARSSPCSGSQDRPASIRVGGRTDTPVNRPFVNKSCIARAPTSRTGVPDNNYRSLQQASSCDYRRRRPEIRANKPDLSLTRRSLQRYVSRYCDS
jgi:hypothetical protein